MSTVRDPFERKICDSASTTGSLCGVHANARFPAVIPLDGVNVGAGHADRGLVACALITWAFNSGWQTPAEAKGRGGARV
jgi:hypothetical protein